MTPEQREILIANVKDDGGEYNIVTIEYPCHYGDTGGNDGLKIVSRSTRVDVDIYRPDGSVETSEYYAREG